MSIISGVSLQELDNNDDVVCCIKRDYSTSIIKSNTSSEVQESDEPRTLGKRKGFVAALSDKKSQLEKGKWFIAGAAAIVMW